MECRMGFDVDPGTLAAARKGDRAAFGVLVEALSRDVYNMAYRVTFNAADAQDLSQEVFVTLYRHLGRYDPERPFAPWFRRVVANTAVNYRARRRPQRSLPETLPTRDPHPEALGPDDVERIEAALKRLPPEYRLVVGFRYRQGLEVGDIAAAMGVPVGTVKTWLFRAREELRSSLSNRFRIRA
jgi:RNA polymerase sigma-70 factor (ECF subfamily)